MLCVLIRIQGDSKQHTQYIIFIIKKKITLDYLKSAAMGFFLRTQGRLRNSRGKRTICGRATEILLYVKKKKYFKEIIYNLCPDDMLVT